MATAMLISRLWMEFVMHTRRKYSFTIFTLFFLPSVNTAQYLLLSSIVSSIQTNSYSIPNLHSVSMYSAAPSYQQSKESAAVTSLVRQDWTTMQHLLEAMKPTLSSSSSSSIPSIESPVLSCSVCCGDCPLNSIEAGFKIYYESEIMDSNDASPSSCSDWPASNIIFDSLFSDIFQINNILLDSFQCMFS